MASASGCREVQQNRDLLLHIAGESVQDIFDTFSDEAASTSYVQAKSVVTAHFTPKNNVPYNRHMFHRESQLDGETVGKYVTRLRQLAVSCEFGDNVQEYIRDQVIDRCYLESLRRRLLAAGKDLSLDSARDCANTRND